jgi:hypothetical protein
MRSPRFDAADGNLQADQVPPPLPAEREAWLDADLHRTLAWLTDPKARLNVAARALAEDIRILRGLRPGPGDAGEPAIQDIDTPF